MTDAPKTIWRVAAYIPQHYAHGLASWPEKEHAGDGAIEYTRTDIAQAELAALQAENAKLREALEPFAFLEEATTQEAWEIRYQDRFKDWIDFGDMESARAVLFAYRNVKGENDAG